MSAKPSLTELRQAADQCVKCAVCLPHCPTYALSPQEAESPRGRITLLQGIVHERLIPTPETFRHLDSCLSCGRCEQVCPARVPYTRLLDGSRFYMSEHPTLSPPPTPAAQRITARLLRSPRTLRLLASGARVGRAVGLQKLLGDSLPGRGLRWTPQRGERVSVTPVEGTPDAWLFTGCLTDAFEADIAHSACRVAAAFGVVLKPAPAGLCCGALYQHQGNRARALELTARTTAALSADDTPVVTLLSGCGRGLKDGLGYSDDPAAGAVATRLIDLFGLLDLAQGPAVIEHADRLALYAPCSLDRAQASRFTEFVTRLSTQDVRVLDVAHGCCGAAGDHMAHDPDRAARLAAPIVEEILSAGFTHVLTPNIGCAWHLRALLAAQGATAVVEHPVQWLARHLPTNDRRGMHDG